MEKQIIHIIGAGPGGLVAAINLAKEGFRVIVHEKRSDVGFRFNGDYQGLDNWTTEKEVKEFLKSIGVSLNFAYYPFYGTELYGPNLKKMYFKTKEPLFYLVERGVKEYSLDQGLKRQALDYGAEFRWNDNVKTIPDGKVIIATGPRSVDALAKGIIFKTNHPDRSVGFVDNNIAPKAYAYLLVKNGKGTFATCMFEDFKNEKYYFKNALERMQKLVKIDIREPRIFGGYGNFFLKSAYSRMGRVYYVGESAGFQDALWGFGMKFAMLSGYLAARSIITGTSYDQLCKQHIEPILKVSLANRLIYFNVGNKGYQWFIDRMARSNDILPTLRKHFRYSTLKKVLFAYAKFWYKSRMVDKDCTQEDCNCAWCRCTREVASPAKKSVPFELA